MRKISVKPDYWILFLAIGLSLFGILMIASSSSLVALERFGGKNNYYFVWRQIISLLLGFFALAVGAHIDFRFWRKNALPLFLINLVLLILVFAPFIGVQLKGAHRWINFYFFLIQPSELIKLTFIIYLASFLQRRKEERALSGSVLPFLGLLLILAVLLILEPDLGTLTIIIASSASVFFAAGVSSRQVVAVGLIILFLIGIFIWTSSYRRQRLLTYFNPHVEKQSTGYHINQATLAIGSGGFWGRGFGNSVQKYLYLPEPHTDSIFAIIVEELGFLRSFWIILAYGILALRGYRIAKSSPDSFSYLLAIGITTWIVFQAIINLGAILGVFPLTGVPLPLISFGGSSLVIILLALGILINISKQRHSEF